MQLLRGVHAQEAETVGPDHVHHQENEDGGRDQGEEEAATFLSKMHEIHEAETGTAQCEAEENGNKEAGGKVLKGKEDFHEKNGQQDKVDWQIFANDVS